MEGGEEEDGRYGAGERAGHGGLGEGLWQASLMRVPPEEFEALVEQALDGLPEEFAELLENVVVVVEEEPHPEDLEALEMDPMDPEDELFGLYVGVPLSERGTSYLALPDRVEIYRGPILRACANRREVIREVRDTVIHELGHHFGLDEDDMPY
jgi:predicted Zn-dependent protease with MMP-like domain